MPWAAEEEPEVIDRVFRLRGGPAEAYACSDKEVVLESGAGTGKSFGLLIKAHDTARDHPGARILFLRKTRKSLSVVLEDWEREVLYRGHPAITGTSHFSSRTLPYTWPNGSEVWLAGIDNPDKIMSSKWDRIFFFEATDCTLRDWEQLLTRLRSFRTPYHQAIADCNPKHEGHWINKRADEPFRVAPGLEGRIEVRPGQTQMTRIQALHMDNPLLWDNEIGDFTPEGAEYMQTLNALTGPRRDNLLLHKWTAIHGLVWPEYIPERHILDGALEKNDEGTWQITLHDSPSRKAPPPIHILSFAASGDKGHRNPGSFLLYGFDREGRMYVVREVYHSGKGVDWWASWLELWHKKYKLRWCAFDPSASDYIDYMNDKLGYRGGRDGVPRLVRGAMNTFEPGRDEVAYRLTGGKTGTPQLFFLRDMLEHEPDPEAAGKYKPTCLLDEIENYIYKPPPEHSTLGDQAPDDPEKPLKKDDHACDSLRYGVFEAFGRKNIPIEKPQGPPPGTLGHTLGWAKAMKAAKRNGHR